MRATDSAKLVELLPRELREGLEDAARVQQRLPGEVVVDAVRQYLKDLHWQTLLNYGRDRARAMGYKPSDVNRLIAEYRRESSAQTG